MNVRFVVTKPAAKAKTFPVRLPILVGRSEEAKFRIQQDRVSRKHCEFFEQDGRVYLRDLGSTNGTLLEGELVETSIKIPLESGAIVRVGSLEFRVEFDTSTATTSRRLAADVDVVSDLTVGVAQAADSERLQVEHTADEPSPEPPPVLTAERPVQADELPNVEVAGDAAPPAESEASDEPEPPPADEAFGFLAGADDAKPAGDDDQLGDFLKGLK
ncbi:MAG: FHA domain-containing protein [Planctomycetia bacterium]